MGEVSSPTNQARSTRVGDDQVVKELTKIGAGKL